MWRNQMLAAMGAAAALACWNAVAQQAHARKLANDPFDRRVVQQWLNKAEPQPVEPALAAAPAVPAAPPAPVLTGDLRALMVGGKQPLVNLGGTILGIGESVDGFRLIEVRERSAVFEREGKRYERGLGRKPDS